MKVQQRKYKKDNKDYRLLWVSLPSQVCHAMDINPGDELDYKFGEKGSLVLKKL